MGKRLSASEEADLLKQLIREAHEATQALNAAIKAANLLAPRLVDDYQATHEREIKQLANVLQIEMNQQASDLNDAVNHARDAIREHIMASEMIADVDAGTVRLLFPPLKFDDHVPIPHEQTPPKVSKT